MEKCFLIYEYKMETKRNYVFEILWRNENIIYYLNKAYFLTLKETHLNKFSKSFCESDYVLWKQKITFIVIFTEKRKSTGP